MKLNKHIVAFSDAYPDVAPLLEKFEDYFNQYLFEVEGKKNKSGSFKTFAQSAEGREVPITFSEKEALINKEFKDVVYKLSGVQNPKMLPDVVWSTNPNVGWYTYAIVSTMIDAVLPDVLIDTIGLYTDIRNVGWGDSAVFNIEPRDLFPVTKAGRGKRMGELQKQFVGQPVSLIPENHQMTVGVALYRVLSGAESLARFAAKAIRSMETQVTIDAYTAFNTAMLALPTTAGNAQLRAAGWSQDTFTYFAQKVSAWNGGAQAIAMGTKRGLAKILPLNANYRYDIESDFVRVGYIRNLAGVDTLELPQVADWENPFGLKLNDDVIYIMSPSAQKPVKLVLEGTTLSYTSSQFDAANLTQTTTFQKSWIAGVATNCVAATITL